MRLPQKEEEGEKKLVRSGMIMKVRPNHANHGTHGQPPGPLDPVRIPVCAGCTRGVGSHACRVGRDMHARDMADRAKKMRQPEVSKGGEKGHEREAIMGRCG